MQDPRQNPRQGKTSRVLYGSVPTAYYDSTVMQRNDPGIRSLCGYPHMNPSDASIRCTCRVMRFMPGQLEPDVPTAVVKPKPQKKTRDADHRRFIKPIFESTE